MQDNKISLEEIFQIVDRMDFVKEHQDLIKDRFNEIVNLVDLSEYHFLQVGSVSKNKSFSNAKKFAGMYANWNIFLKKVPAGSSVYTSMIHNQEDLRSLEEHKADYYRIFHSFHIEFSRKISTHSKKKEIAAFLRSQLERLKPEYDAMEAEFLKTLEPTIKAARVEHDAKTKAEKELSNAKKLARELSGIKVNLTGEDIMTLVKVLRVDRDIAKKLASFLVQRKRIARSITLEDAKEAAELLNIEALHNK